MFGVKRSIILFPSSHQVKAVAENIVHHLKTYDWVFQHENWKIKFYNIGGQKFQLLPFKSDHKFIENFCAPMSFNVILYYTYLLCMINIDLVQTEN